MKQSTNITVALVGITDALSDVRRQIVSLVDEYDAKIEKLEKAMDDPEKVGTQPYNDGSIDTEDGE